jgi:hypothetical protein
MQHLFGKQKRFEATALALIDIFADAQRMEYEHSDTGQQQRKRNSGKIGGIFYVHRALPRSAILFICGCQILYARPVEAPCISSTFYSWLMRWLQQATQFLNFYAISPK